MYRNLRGGRTRRFRAKMDEEVSSSSPPPTIIITKSGQKITRKFQQLSLDDDSGLNSEESNEPEMVKYDGSSPKMDGISESVIQPRKKVEVFYIPDSLIENIISNNGDKRDATPHTRRIRNARMDQEMLDTSPTLMTRMTRSGRKITSKFKQLSLNDDSSGCNVNERAEPEITKPCVIPEALFENNDIDGKEMFSFRTPKHRNGMANKASEVAARTEDTTPRRKSTKSIWTPNPVDNKVETSKTPYSLRNQIRKRLVDEVAKQELDRLLEDSGSDYIPTSSSESESSDSDDDIVKHQPDDDHHQPTPPKKSRKQVKDYVFTSEEYFDRRYSNIMTSGHTLKKLKTPRLAHNQLTALLKAIPTTHKKSMDFLFRGTANSFKHWLFCFSEGYNVLLYGLGSKRNVLESFRNRHLQSCNVIHINGYFPDNSIKQILDAITSEFLGIENAPTQPHEVLELIKEKLDHKYAKRVFILLANLDGKAFQNDKSQAIFAQLARIEKVHLVVTVDHINSALLWDHSKLSAFNFIWEDCTNYEPYLDETSYEGSLMVNWSGGLALASLKNVFHSLTVNSRKVFKILLEHQFENKNGKHIGMHFSELYRQCREGFIVSSDLALRTLLTEFTDHELVKWKKDTDHLLITVDQNVLKQFREEIDLDK